MSITALPTPPQRSDGPETFANNGDVFIAALPAFVTQANALEANVNAKEISAVSSAEIALAASNAAVSATNAPVWVSGTFAFGDVRWSPINSLSYRCRVAGVRATDPSLDATNWAQLTTLPVQTGNSGKYISTNGTAASWVDAKSVAETLTNKTISLGSNTISGTLAQLNAAISDADIAPIASPSLTGVPAAPTATKGTNTTQIATTAFVRTEAASALSTFKDEALAFSLAF